MALQVSKQVRFATFKLAEMFPRYPHLADVSLMDVAKKVDISYGFLYKIMRGEKPAFARDLLKIALELKIPVDEFIRGLASHAKLDLATQQAEYRKHLEATQKIGTDVKEVTLSHQYRKPVPIE